MHVNHTEMRYYEHGITVAVEYYLDGSRRLIGRGPGAESPVVAWVDITEGTEGRASDIARKCCLEGQFIF